MGVGEVQEENASSHAPLWRPQKDPSLREVETLESNSKSQDHSKEGLPQDCKAALTGTRQMEETGSRRLEERERGSEPCGTNAPSVEPSAESVLVPMGKGKQPVSSPEDSGGKSSEGLLPIVQGRTERPQEVAPKNSRNFLSRVFSAMVGSGSDTDPRMATSHINAPSVGEDAPPVDGHSNEVER